jgi:hypothetical protein
MELLLAAMTMRVAIKRAGIPSLVISSPLTLDRLKARALQSYLEALAKILIALGPPPNRGGRTDGANLCYGLITEIMAVRLLSGIRVQAARPHELLPGFFADCDNEHPS